MSCDPIGWGYKAVGVAASGFLEGRGLLPFCSEFPSFSLLRFCSDFRVNFYRFALHAQMLHYAVALALHRLTGTRAVRLARCSRGCAKHGRIRKKAADADGTVRCRRSLHGPRHRPSGTWLSSGIMPASPVAVPTTRAPEHLEPQLALGTRTRRGTFDRSSLEVAIAMMKPTNSDTQ